MTAGTPPGNEKPPPPPIPAPPHGPRQINETLCRGRIIKGPSFGRDEIARGYVDVTVRLYLVDDIEQLIKQSQSMPLQVSLTSNVDLGELWEDGGLG